MGLLRACCFGFWFDPRTLWVLEGSCLKGRDVSSCLGRILPPAGW